VKIHSFITKHQRDFGVIGFLLAYCVVMAFRHKEFLNPGDIRATLDIHLSILKQGSLIAVVAAGMTMVIISAGIDLSVGSLVILTSCLAAGLMVKSNIPVAAAFVISIAIGTLCGALNGFLSSWGGLPPFIATLGMMSIARGLSYLYCNAVAAGTTIFGLPAGARFFSSRITGPRGFSIPLPIIIMVAVVICTHIVLTRTKLGRYTYAIGANEEVARLAGINVNKIKLTVYAISGGLCALAGFIYIGELNSANAEGLIGFELDVIAAVVIGGTSLMGGEGKVFGSFVGALLIAYIRDGLTREGAGTEWGMLVIGSIILAAVAFDNMMKKGSVAGLAKLFRTGSK